ncbi:MAG: radical SAM protein [Candidatus Lernaella stagnicola]|nr:radical SAM protein [Candidatus Lernaella stagnicola]
MRVVLFRPPVFGPKEFPVVVDLGLLYLAKALRQAEIPVAVRDGHLETKPERGYALDLVTGDEPVLVGIKLFSLGIAHARRAIANIKKINPRAVTVVGGPHPSGVAGQLWRDVPEADFGWTGEGEIGLPKLVRALEAGGRDEDLAQVPGLVWRRDEKAVVNAPAFLDDLDALDQPAWDAVPVAGYLARPTPIRKQPHLSILTSRGCPFDCSYCAGRLITGRRMRFRSGEKVVDEMAMLRERYGVTTFAITDDNFSLNQRHVEGFCHALIDRDLPGVRWDCLATGLRLDSLSADLLRLMERSGCYACSVAVESGSPRVLEHMQKGVDLDTMREAIALIRRTTKMRVNTYFILGYPTETRADLRASIRFARRSGAHHAQFFLFTPLPGAPITDILRETGKLPAVPWEKFRFDRPSVPLVDVSLAGLKRRQIWATLSFYFSRPWRLAALVRDVWSPAVVRDVFRRLLALFVGRK